MRRDHVERPCDQKKKEMLGILSLQLFQSSQLRLQIPGNRKNSSQVLPKLQIDGSSKVMVLVLSHYILEWFVIQQYIEHSLVSGTGVGAENSSLLPSRFFSWSNN